MYKFFQFFFLQLSQVVHRHCLDFRIPVFWHFFTLFILYSETFLFQAASLPAFFMYIFHFMPPLEVMLNMILFSYRFFVSESWDFSRRIRTSDRYGNGRLSLILI